MMDKQTESAVRVDSPVETDGCEAGYRAIDGCVRVQQGRRECVTEKVALEVPVSISFDGVYYNVLSCTPRDLEDLAYGVAFSSGIISSAEDVCAVEVKTCGSYGDVDVSLKSDVYLDPSSFRLSSISGLPARGSKIHLTPYFPAHMVHIEAEQPIPPSAICAASQGLLERQRMHIDTGATHAASFVDRHGTFLYMSEDIGRHNAVDKLVGQLVRNHVDPSSGFVFLSSRCALELVNKVARYGVGVVATVSAPTSAVIEFAREANVTLCAFARGNRFTVYTHPERIAAE